MRTDPVSFLRTRALSAPELKRLDKVDCSRFEKALESGVEVTTEADFGEDLRMISFPPPALFVWGDKSALKRPMVAIVGTRGASTYGKAVARKFSEAMAQAGLTVVSGGALGIDEHAHIGALDVAGLTVVALANGVEKAQPPRNKPLFDRVRASGCLVSPYAVGTPALPENFRQRNVLIAAMAKAVIVIEAPAGSGALMAAGAAADLGREVFVVPGPINSVNFNGSHNLIRDGATLVFHPGQVLEALDFEAPAEVERSTADNEAQRSILAALEAEPLAVEVIATRTDLDSTEVTTELTMMEIEGLVVRNELGYTVKP